MQNFLVKQQHLHYLSKCIIGHCYFSLQCRNTHENIVSVNSVNGRHTLHVQAATFGELVKCSIWNNGISCLHSYQPTNIKSLLL